MTTVFSRKMQPEPPSLIVVHLEGVRDNVLSVPLFGIISHSFKDYERNLLLSPRSLELGNK